MLRPISSRDVDWQVWSGGRFGVKYRHLTRASVGAGYRVGVAIEELNPGKQSTPAHYHVQEEEHVYVLDGALTVRCGTKRFTMHSGDYICFPARQRAGHCLINDSGASCRYVIIGENDPDEVVIYTDSRKVLVRALGEGAIFDLDAVRGYWDGEGAGLPESSLPPFAEDPINMDPVKLGPDDPLPPIAADAVEWHIEGKGRAPVYGGRSRHLTYAAAGAGYRVGVLIEAPAPGMRLAPRHYHMREEEHALVLEGTLTLLLGDERHEMQPGDYVCFPAGQTVPHSFLNGGDGPCSYLMIGQNDPADVCVYPDSSMMSVRALRTGNCVFAATATRDYWDGE